MLNKVELRSRMGAKATSAKRVFVGRCIWGLARHVVIEFSDESGKANRLRGHRKTARPAVAPVS